MTGTHTDATKSESTNENGETARRGQSRRCMSHLVQHDCQCTVQCTGKAASWKFELGRQRSTPRNYCKQLAIATQLDAHIFPWPVRSSHKLRIERDIEQSEPEENEVYTSTMKHTKMIRKKKASYVAQRKRVNPGT